MQYDAAMDDWKIERRFNVGWRPKLRDTGNSAKDMLDIGDFGDDLGALVIIPVLLVLGVVLIIAAPLLLFVLELALLLVIIVPLALLALVVGLRRHELVARNEQTGKIVRRHARGVISSVRCKRQWKREIAQHGEPVSR